MFDNMCNIEHRAIVRGINGRARRDEGACGRLAEVPYAPEDVRGDPANAHRRFAPFFLRRAPTATRLPPSGEQDDEGA